MRRVLLISALLAASCAQLPLTPQDIEARKFEAVPGKSVIYLLRDVPDHSGRAAAIQLGDDVLITTYPGTYYRWEVPPGTHRIAGYVSDNGTITLRTEPGRIYFVQQRLLPLRGVSQSYFAEIREPEARAAVGRSVLLATR